MRTKDLSGGERPASVAKKSAFVVMTNGDLGWQLIAKLTSGEAMTRLLG